MTNRMNWIRTGLACVLALGMGAQASLAAERCDRPISGRDDRVQYRDSSRGSGYGASYGSYRDSSYRDSNYRDSSYRDSNYRDSYTAPGYRDNSYRNQSYYGYSDYQPQRSAGKSAAIIGGSAAAGAAVGALAGGGKGAAIGAAVGAIGGLVYDRATKNNDVRNRW